MDPLDEVMFVDIETASLVDIMQSGAWPYSRDPSTEVYVISFGREDDGPGETTLWTPCDELPEHVVDFVRGQGILVAHNASFEQSIWANILVPRYGFPPVDISQWRCTQAMGLAINLPKSLANLALALGCPVQKDLEGSELMKKMARTVKRAGTSFSYPMNTEENLERLSEYCEQDVLATRDCYKRLPKLSLTEQRVWFADQEINARGVYLDRTFALRCLDFANHRGAFLDFEAFETSWGELSSASAAHGLKAWLKLQGVELRKVARPNGTTSEVLDARATKQLLNTDDLPAPARQALERRVEAGKVTSLAKLRRVDQVTDPDDGRLRHGLQFQAAHTGRWASYGLQLHNLPKVKLSPVELSLARTIVTKRCDLDTMELCFDRPLQVLSQLLRSVIAAPPGRELIAADYSAIEARVVAWLAGQDDITSLFAKGDDVYTYAAHRIGSDDRQLGKVSTLMLGFGAGVIKFVDTAASWGVTLDLKEARRVVMAWRASNYRIAQFWHDMGTAAHSSVLTPGKLFTAGKVRCYTDRKGHHLQLILPSERKLYYWAPRLARVKKLIPVVNEDGEIETTEFEANELRFDQAGPGPSGRVQTSTYGGKLVENVTQAVARDLLANALLTLRSHPPYDVVMHVHDAVAAEVPADAGDVEEFCRLIEQVPAWATGLPVAAEGYRATRFRG